MDREERVRRFIVGTAGHIDHGKTALLRALTGIDADRLPEEKARGITIDLGFAHLEQGETRIGFIDAPGHERFVRNMLAGAGGLDAILLVVAADEGIMPQTREHLAIAGMLGLQIGLVALTKIDRVSPEIVEVAESETLDYLRGSFLEGAPVHRVSARTGAGIDLLRSALLSLAGADRREREEAPLRLPVDRAFTVAGFGPVVTGSLVSGAVSPEDRVEILPESKTVRVRRVEVHGRESPRALAGERTSINLAGVELSELARGQMIAAPGTISPATRLLAAVTLLPGAPGLESGDGVVFYHFASETPARVRLLGPDRLAGGESAAALLALARPVAAAVFDRFILRRASPPATIGGGEILDVHPPRKLEPADLADLGGVDRTARLRRRIEREPAGIPIARLAREEYLPPEQVRDLLAGSLDAGEIVETLPGSFYLSRRREAALASDARRLVEEEIGRRPGARGAPRATVLEKVLSRFELRTGEALLRRFVEKGLLQEQGDELRLPGGAGLPAAEQTLASRIAGRFDEKGLDPPSPAALAAELSAKPKIVEGLIGFLVKEKRLLRLPGGLLISAAAVRGVVDRLRSSGKETVSVAEFKEMFSLTRKMAIPLLEHLDEARITRRVGDLRRIQPPAAEPARRSSSGE